MSSVAELHVPLIAEGWCGRELGSRPLKKSEAAGFALQEKFSCRSRNAQAPDVRFLFIRIKQDEIFTVLLSELGFVQKVR